MPDAVTVDRVGKLFKRYLERPTSIKERIVRFRLNSEQFWALRDVSFDVPEGQTLGLLGVKMPGPLARAASLARARSATTIAP